MQVYYVAMVNNVIVRFIFVWYAPAPGKVTKLRSFIFAVMEMLRRWQWNFCMHTLFTETNRLTLSSPCRD
jgi:hypothetical protein